MSITVSDSSAGSSGGPAVAAAAAVVASAEIKESARCRSNFDVLLVADQETGILNYYHPDVSSGPAKHHVGNQRFQVTLNMHRHDFETRHTRGQDTSPIVNKLISIVTEQCVPPGRFLQRSNETIMPPPKSADVETKSEDDGNCAPSRENSSSSDDGWIEVPRALVEEFIERSLMPSPNESKKATKSILLHNGGHVSPKSGRSRRISFVDMDSSPALLDPDEDNSTPASQSAAGALAPPPLPTGKDVAEDEKKRRRRSSLLRRSLSDQLLPPAALDLFNKKKMNRTTEERRPSLWRAFGKHKLVKHPETLDIVITFTSDKDENDNSNSDSVGEGNEALSMETADLMPNDTTGNNRLRVLMQMHKERYSQVSTDKQAKMIQDWIHTVTKYWKGRFLKFDTILESYEVLDAGQVETGLAIIMSKMLDGNDFDGKNMSGALHRREGDLNQLWEISEGGESNDSFRADSSSDLLGASHNSQLSVSSAPVHLSKLQPVNRRQRQVSSANSVASAPPTQQKRRSMKNFLPQLPHFSELARGVSDSVVNRGSTSTASGSMGRPQSRQQHRGSVSSRMSVDSKLPDPLILPTSSSESQSDMRGMRSAAVESLQRRKKRQGLASRIQRLAQNSLRRASGAISTAAAQAAASSSSSTAASGSAWNENSNNSSGFSDFPPPPRNILSSSFRRTSVMSTVSSASSSSHTRGGRHNVPASLSPPPSSGVMRRTSASSVSTAGSSRMDMQPYSEEIVFDSKPPPAVFTQWIPEEPSSLQQQHQNKSSVPERKDQPLATSNMNGPETNPNSYPTSGSLLDTKSLGASALERPNFTTMAPPAKEEKSDVAAVSSLLQEDLLPSPRSSLNKADVDFDEDDVNSKKVGLESSPSS